MSYYSANQSYGGGSYGGGSGGYDYSGYSGASGGSQGQNYGQSSYNAGNSSWGGSAGQSGAYGSGSYGSSTGSYGAGSGAHGAGSGSYGAGAGAGSYGSQGSSYGGASGGNWGSYQAAGAQGSSAAYHQPPKPAAPTPSSAGYYPKQAPAYTNAPPKPVAKPAPSWGYTAAPAKPAAPSWQQPAANSWQQPTNSWQQPAKPAAPQWPAQHSVPKPSPAAPWAKPTPKPAPVAKPWAAAQGMAPPKPAAPWGQQVQPKPAAQALAAIQQAKAAAEALRQQAVVRRPGVPVSVAKPFAPKPAPKPVAATAAMAHVRLQQQQQQQQTLQQQKFAQQQAVQKQQERAAIAAKAVQAAAAKQAARVAVRQAPMARLIPRVAGLPKAVAKPVPVSRLPATSLSPATSAALAALAAAKAKAKPAAATTPGAKPAPKPVPKPAVVPKPKPKSLPWVDQLSKLVLIPWTHVNRPVLDLLRRFPTVHLAPDLVSANCSFADEDWRDLVPLDPLVETLAVDEAKDRIKDEDVELTGDKKRIIRIALMTGKLLNVPTHLANRIQFVLHKAADPACLPGGPWDPKSDGADPEKPATLKKAAVRILKELYDLDLSGCNFHRFMDLEYLSAEGEKIQTTILLPDVWTRSELPLKLGRIVKEEEKEVIRFETTEEPMTEEDKEAAKKEFADRIAKQRAEAQKPRPGERELARVERLEKLEETLKQLEKAAPAIKDTKTVKKEVKEMKTVKKELSKPAFLSLHTMRELSQMLKEGPAKTAVFETKLFALCFDELIRLEMGLKIINWMQSYKVRAKEENEVRTAKRKRDFEQIQERDKVVRERLAKRQKLEQEKKAADKVKRKVEAEKASMREADRLELEQIEKEKKEKEKKEEEKPEAEAAEEKKEEPEEPEAPLPPLKLTKFVYDLDEEATKPFLYFDSSAQAPSGNISRSDLLQIFHRTGVHCQREVQELVKTTLIETPAVRNVGAGMFSYRGACSVQREVEQEEKPADAPAEDAKADAKEEKAAEKKE